MTLHDLTLLEQHLMALRALVMRDDGVESAAYMLCGINWIASDPWERRRRLRLTSHDVATIPKKDRISASKQHVTWFTASFVELLKRAKDDNLVPAIIHSHPNGPAAFSEQDDRNERDLVQLAQNRNGRDAPLLSVLFAGDGQVIARLWFDGGAPAVVAVRAVGRHLTIHEPSEGIGFDFLGRQALAFGTGLNATLRSMRVGVVGCGGTGSATAILLARLGVGQIALFDNDVVETTNLNRLHGARRSDADGMEAKVDVVAREIAKLGLGVRAVPVRSWIGEPGAREVLKACDLIFGCTDDHDGRLLLNRLAYFYLIPVLDMGLAIAPALAGAGVRDLSGRVTVLIPGAPCLLCRGIVDPVTARDEQLRRADPEEHERRKREAYVRGGGNPAPAVVTFTTATACMAVDEMVQGLTGFRGDRGWEWQRVRRFDLMQDRRPGAEHDPDCPICTDRGYWGRADIDPFLDRVG
ncbi:MAG: ThiF family adenylyltransferase [Erythrobacter sp.]|jgi:molybdopterin/thiamine biosynthesis adenylyltransferase|nr:ThiF family adenylyltransferase [Erythrobacter sp.]